MFENIINKTFTNQLSRKLGFLYLLNISDWFCTLALLNSGYFAEANPFMSGVITNLPMSFAIKCLIPLLLVVYVNRRANDASEKQIKFSSRIIVGAIILYTLINLSHVANFLLLFILV